MKTNRTSLYFTDKEVEQTMKELAKEHDRSLNSEIVQACKAWIHAHKTSTSSEKSQQSSDAIETSGK